ncbi:hypothetical protein N7509_003947 [Penicillium cosmopolitanum]|uniref:Uncharacterized protein n=1 Tax=Penicillium cosmopolitanum TaxID=1131564 RepID=A0A9W9W698_9EURO|nr:uncharacterized protein N7509_003947 [Penicillium cosmopolitanum]KAJ5404076.1 hypothetical protein N7509_003947 [Penicillium cosmopolitanum]
MTTEIFKRLQSYNFQDDAEFATGLAIILGHPETPASEAEMNREDDLVLQAKCFFFSRKENISPPINFAAYKAWLASPTASATATQQESGSDLNTGLSQPQSSAESGTASSEPAYPTSFAHIVELITTGQPIPGIEEIPDTVLEGHDLATEKPRRRKPWEKDDVTAAPASAPTDETTTTTGAV